MDNKRCAIETVRPVTGWALLAREPSAEALSPPRIRPPACGLSGRPTCRIYARSGLWILELDAVSGGWLDEDDGFTRRLTFSWLVEAIGYAECHGLDYRIERPGQHPCGRRIKPASGQLPRSWLARLARNGRNGDIYHG